MKRLSRFAMFVMALSLLIVMIAPASAITDGELAGDDHPELVLIVMEVDDPPAFRCSGILLSATIVLTAGHCTNNFLGSPHTGMRVFTKSKIGASDKQLPVRWQQRSRSCSVGCTPAV